MSNITPSFGTPYQESYALGMQLVVSTYMQGSYIYGDGMRRVYDNCITRLVRDFLHTYILFYMH